MTTLREAAEQALKAMEKATRYMSDADYRRLNESIEVLRAALAEPEQEWASIPGTNVRVQIRREERKK